MHITNENAEKIIGKVFKVLDKGEIELIDYMGLDGRIAEAARVSYKDVKTRSEDEKLIDYLMRNDHTSPFEQVVFTFRLKMPIFVARQWQRHRTARMNEVSGRYSVMTQEFYIPSCENINVQSESNRQGRGEKLNNKDAKKALDLINEAYEKCSSAYQSLLDMNIAKEIARMVLPLSLYTQMYWQIDLHNLFHFLKLRLDGHAQFEIREYANVLYDILKEIVPMASSAFEKHKLNTLILSESEAETVIGCLDGQEMPTTERDKRILNEKISNFKSRKKKH